MRGNKIDRLFNVARQQDQADEPVLAPRSSEMYLHQANSAQVEQRLVKQATRHFEHSNRARVKMKYCSELSSE
jgi:hypothetical protein